ncbi:hypothetical protein SAMN04488601_1011391 [Paenibacillus sp. 453mf]|nr:hypothetical protein SAMN04488601_1011391 [Paenibacillus sp. 453mf]
MDKEKLRQQWMKRITQYQNSGTNPCPDVSNE